MNSEMNVLMIFILATLSIFSAGCFDEDENGNLEISGHVVEEDEGDEATFTYRFTIDTVKNGPAYFASFSFKLENAHDGNVLEGKSDFIGLDGTAIQYADITGDINVADPTDYFILVALEDCTGGELHVYYDGDEMGVYDIA